jgi:hypothetical protein
MDSSYLLEPGVTHCIERVEENNRQNKAAQLGQTSLSGDGLPGSFCQLPLTRARLQFSLHTCAELENYTTILEAQGFAAKTHNVRWNTATRPKKNVFPAARCLKAPDYCSFLALIGVGLLPAIEFAVPNNPTSEAEFGCRGALFSLTDVRRRVAGWAKQIRCSAAK